MSSVLGAVVYSFPGPQGPSAMTPAVFRFLSGKSTSCSWLNGAGDTLSTARGKGRLDSKPGSALGSEWPGAHSFMSLTLSLPTCEVGMIYIPLSYLKD